ncbi:Neoverrucotoxin subunit beta [Pelomyxa schiedti]|nr:Neoverrucotoxin subunit beta [Pelomyxa schiedti]
MVVDDRGSSQTESVTKWVTVYRLRPISPAMGGKTILIVDTPGFYDTGGIESDNRTTEAIGHLFGLLTHVNALVFVCKCQEVRKNVLEPVVTMVFHLFAKDVHDCLRTILTFADLSEPLTLGTLGALQWPVKPDDTWVKVNNCAFGLKATEAEIGDWWRISVNSQRRVHQMLQMPAVSTCQSVQVAKYRTQVEGMCDRLRLEITQAMEGLNGVLNHLNGIAESIGAPPTKLVPVARPVKRHFEAPKGYLLTFCTVCARVCHNRCVYPEGRCRDTCAVMYHQKCTRCPNHCGFDKHNNARCFDGISVETDNVVSAELLSQWNGRRASAEGSILKTIEEYQGLQANLHRQLTDLKRVSRCLEEQALKHRPGVLVSHLKTLIGLAKKEGRPTCQLDSFLQNLELQDIASSTPGSASSPTSPSVSAEAPTRALFMVKHELERQNRSQNAQTGVVSFYNALVAILPAELTLPPDVPRTITGSTYAENLKATVKLTHFLLSRTVAVASHDS